MEIIKTAIEGVVIIEPRLFKDDRGYFFESFSQREFTEKVRKVDFVQDNESKSSYGVLRGLHFQKPPYAQSKLVRVIKGSVLDVAVDIRKGSPTFGEHVSVELTEENHRQFFIPRGFAHGFVVLTEEVIFQYKCDNFYAPHERHDGWSNLLMSEADGVLCSEEYEDEQSPEKIIELYAECIRLFHSIDISDCPYTKDRKSVV